MDDKEEILFATYYKRIPDSKSRQYQYMSKKAENNYDQLGMCFGYIIKKANEKSNQLRGDTHYEWGTPSAEEAKVFALQAELYDVKSENLQIAQRSSKPS